MSTVTESGDFKIHVYGDGNFIVDSAGVRTATNPSIVDYLVVAGGGGGGSGLIVEMVEAEKLEDIEQVLGDPLQGTAITITATTFTISVGGGGAAA